MRNAPPAEPTAPTRRGRMSRKRKRRLIVFIASAVVCALIAAAAVVVLTYRQVTGNIVRSDFVLPQVVEEFAPDPGEQNVLIMGMDSRVDQNGNPLPDEVYEALHAGGADDGGYNANVLMLLHIPEDRSQTVGISIPRDDYVEIAGAPLGVTHSKIKEAYGLAMQERLNELLWDEDSERSEEEAYQEARAAGRQAQIETVSHFLGDVRIDHFVEMTMGGFYHVAEAVAPISVCLNQATVDTFSGADFAEGVQELDASQAMSFVRQRRDTSDDGPFLTDLDRSRRQQAFLIALADKLRQKSTLMNPKTVWSLVGVTQQHVALDSEFDVLGFVGIAHEVAQSGVRFVTLPIIDFDTIDGAAVNVVDPDEIRAIVAAVLDGSYFAAPAEEEAPDGDAEGDDASQDEAGREEAGEGGAEAPATGASARGTASYDSWDEPIQAGSMPCVN